MLRRVATWALSAVLLAMGLTAPSAAETRPTATAIGEAAVLGVHVNQLGYLPDGPKSATFLSSVQQRQRWTLRLDGAVVAQGWSQPAGRDPSSGLDVHVVDFSSVHRSGEGFELHVGGAVGEPFAIRDDLYAALRTDAMRFFYGNRSGIAIEEAIAGAGYGRDAGHVSTSPNGGDTAVPCQEPRAYANGWTCDYTLDVSGGWYDAGDLGKYVVNGGIATWQLMSAWERAEQAGTTAGLEDGALAVPERGNGVPDVLDEARWSLEFLLSMQVPAGEPLAGMVHHKVHGETWGGLPLLPGEDTVPRSLHRPSTAATLNLAAVAAQGARVLEAYDPAFADELLTAAETAYAAAAANPVLLAPDGDGEGGGPYGDRNVDDERYWAAAELYLTTGAASYRDAVLAHPLHTASWIFQPEGFSWGSVAVPARLDLARFGDDLPGIEEVRQSVVDGADRLAALQEDEAFGQAYTPSSGRYEWGSNSQVLNNQVVLATAYDLAGDPVHRDAALESMDYLLGRNALGISYVTGYGTYFAQNQHHRWYAASVDASLPHPPPGTLAGGANSGLQDPVASATLTGCAPQRCYLDDLEAWSVNEVTINWNSALVWMASFAADVE